MKRAKIKPTAGRFVISKSKTTKNGFFTEEVVYKSIIGGKCISRTKHKRILK